MGGAGSLIIGMLHISNLQPAFSSDENFKEDVKHEHWLEISMKSTKKSQFQIKVTFAIFSTSPGPLHREIDL